MPILEAPTDQLKALLTILKMWENTLNSGAPRNYAVPRSAEEREADDKSLRDQIAMIPAIEAELKQRENPC